MTLDFSRDPADVCPLDASSEDRLQYIFQLRREILAEREVPDAFIRHAIELLRINREEAASSRRKKRTKPVPLSLDDF